MLEQFKTQKALQEAVRAVVDRQPMHHVFGSDLIAELIATRHYYCAPAGLRPTIFRKVPVPGQLYQFQALFDPPLGWHAVSWLKCTKPHKGDDEITAAFRRLAAPDVMARQRAYHTCERCGVAPSTETDHVCPEFKDIVAGVLRDLGPSETNALLATFDWSNPAPFTIPPGPARMLFNSRHDDATLQAVCTACHLLNAKDRKGK